MKRFILLFLSLSLGVSAMAQVGGAQFNAYISGGQNQMNTMPQSQTQAFSVTAYSADAYGNLQSQETMLYFPICIM